MTCDLSLGEENQRVAIEGSLYIVCPQILSALGGLCMTRLLTHRQHCQKLHARKSETALKEL